MKKKKFLGRWCTGFRTRSFTVRNFSFKRIGITHEGIQNINDLLFICLFIYFYSYFFRPIVSCIVRLIHQPALNISFVRFISENTANSFLIVSEKQQLKKCIPASVVGYLSMNKSKNSVLLCTCKDGLLCMFILQSHFLSTYLFLPQQTTSFFRI